MNALKNILFFGLLFAVLCGVYFSLSRQPEQPLPAGLDSNVKPPTVVVPGLDSPAAGSANPPAANNPSLATTPPKSNPWPSAGDAAPPTRFAGAPRPMPGGADDHVAVGPPPPRESGAANTPPGLRAEATSPAPPSNSLPPPPDTGSARNYPAGVRDPFGQDNLAAGRNSAASAAPPAATQVSLPGPPEEHGRPSSIETILQQVALKVQENKLADALLLLTPLQDNPDVSPSKARQITEILDYMAARVIYSREHLLERPMAWRRGTHWSRSPSTTRCRPCCWPASMASILRICGRARN